MHGGGGHWKAQLRAQWESTRRRANAGAQTDALYADAGAQTTRPAYADGGAQTLLGSDDEDARPAPSYASDDEADARLAARIVAPAPAKLGLVAPALNEQPPALTGSTLVEADGKSASARLRPPRSGAPPQSQTPAAASGAPGPGTITKGSLPAHPPSSQNMHSARSPPPPYAPPASPLRLAPPSASHSGSGSGSVSASSPSRSRKAMSPPVSVPKSPAVPVPVSPSAPVPVSPSAPAVAAEAPPQRERLFIRIPARKRPVPAPALEPQTPVEQQLGSPTLVLSPPPPEAAAVSGRKRPRARPLDEGSPAKRALPASNGHSVQVSEPVAGPSRLAAPNGEHVAVESVPAAVRAKRQTKTTKSRVAPLPPPAPTTAVSSYAAAPAPARARQWPSLSMTALAPSAPAAETEPPGPTLSIAEALAAPPVEQARPLVPRKRTRSPSAGTEDRATATPRREGMPAGAPASAAAAAHASPKDVSSRKPPSPATTRRLAHTEAEHEQIPERNRDAVANGVHVPSVANVQTAPAVGPGNSASPDRRSGPAARPATDDAASTTSPNGARASAEQALGSTDSLDATVKPRKSPEQPAKRAPRMRGPPPARDAQNGPAAAGPSAAREERTAPAPAPPPPAPLHSAPESLTAVTRATPATALNVQATAHPPPIREQATPPKRAPTSTSAAPAPAPSVSSSPARPKITLRLKLPRAPSPPVRDKTESPIGMCFPSPPAPAHPAPVAAPSRAVPPELLAAFGGPGEEDSPVQARAPGLDRSRAGAPAPAPDPAVDQGVEGAFVRPDGGVGQDAAPRERSPDSAPSRAVSPLPRLLDPAVLADAHARPEQEGVLRDPARSPSPQPASAVDFRGAADADKGMDMDTAEDGAPAHTASAREPSVDVRARADSPDLATSFSPQNDADDEDADINMEEDGAPARPASVTPPRAPSLADAPESVSGFYSRDAEHADTHMAAGDAPSPTPANDAPSPPSAAAPRKRGRTPSLEQRALSSPRRSSTPASPLILPSPPPPPQLHTSPPPQALRSSPQPAPSPAAGSGPMSPPWSPVALPDEMMQLLMLGGEPLPMPVFDPLPPPPAPDEEDEFNSGVEDEVERMLEVAPQPEEKPAKKRKRRATGRRKSRAVVGDSD